MGSGKEMPPSSTSWKESRSFHEAFDLYVYVGLRDEISLDYAGVLLAGVYRRDLKDTPGLRGGSSAKIDV